MAVRRLTSGASWTSFACGFAADLPRIRAALDCVAAAFDLEASLESSARATASGRSTTKLPAQNEVSRPFK